ncbi:ubiquitin carboxyl-terminal hydrolase 36 isoform X2 [Homalodisca vitripennis]|uniref:ubiquitin carboxyl-terminal hydrolase 36 isoform X2 n=1 Tax=Homalodisca vitripennis TaxID=197043 RepID=UPI001EEA3DFD|nr:ubiquitin carboxyl-terminal hydrolase 36 isoform X2 [Homalodisca vitripennis]
MPASSGDPISAALKHSLAASSKFTSDGDSLDSKLIGSAKHVLLTEIKYDQTGSFSNTVLDLKSKYIILKPPTSLENGEIKLKNGLSKGKDAPSEVKTPPSPGNSGSSSCSSNNSSSSSCSKPSSSSTKPVSPGSGSNKADAVLPLPKRILFPPEKIQLGWQSKSVPIGSGMINLGNTCYLNSTLQALFHVPAFVNWLLNDKAHKDKCETMNGLTHTECLICAMLKTLKCSMENSASSSPIRPHLIYNKLKLICKRLIHGHQEDAHEFLRYLIESMDRSYLRLMQANNLDSYSKETTPLSQIFGGYLRTEVRCLECRNISLTFQHFQDLLLDIRQATTVDEALEAYFSRERLGDGEEAYRCDKCHRRVAATKQFTVEKPPNVLCIQLKRFGIMGGKNSRHIQVQQTLDLTKFWVHRAAHPGCRLSYKLMSLVMHIGPSTNCGHYTAIGLTSSGQLYLFDDSVVRLVSNHAVSGNNVYIMMYELVTPNPYVKGTPTKTAVGNCTVTKPSPASSNVNGTSSFGKSAPTPLTNGTYASGKVSQPSTPLKTILNSSAKPTFSGNPLCAKSCEKEELGPLKKSPAHNGINGREDHQTTPKENGHSLPDTIPDEHKNGVIKNGRIPNGKNWDGSRSNGTVEFLRKNSHQGYGTNVSTWNGNRTQVDRDVENDRNQQRKRSYDQMYNNEYDQGKVKKVKSNSHYMKNSDRDMNGRRNLFQEHQNHKNNNNWYGDRNHFYRAYTNNHIRSFQNNRNPNYHWKR